MVLTLILMLIKTYQANLSQKQIRRMNEIGEIENTRKWKSIGNEMEKLENRCLTEKKNVMKTVNEKYNAENKLKLIHMELEVLLRNLLFL